MGRTTLLQRCARVHVELEAAEKKVEELRERKRALAQELYERDGPGGVYDLGDGRPMILSKSRSGGYFFTPKDKWKRRDEKKKGKQHMGHVKTSTAHVIEQPEVKPIEGYPDTPPGGRGEGGTPTLPPVGEMAEDRRCLEALEEAASMGASEKEDWEDPLERALRELREKG